jgi:hypothetical protein
MFYFWIGNKIGNLNEGKIELWMGNSLFKLKPS